MPQTRLRFFQGLDGVSPVWEWLKELRATNPKAYAKCVVRIRRLGAAGHELRRPEADFLRDGVYELRARLGSVNYRILYFFHGRNVAVLAHAVTKEDEIPAIEIDRALERKRMLSPIQPPTRFQETYRMSNQKIHKRTSDALVLLERLTGKDQKMADLLEQERANLDIAQKIYQLRIKAGLSQIELARKVGTTQSVISRLEDADYEGHSLAMLRRIAAALKKRVEIRFLPARRLQHA